MLRGRTGAGAAIAPARSASPALRRQHIGVAAEADRVRARLGPGRPAAPESRESGPAFPDSRAADSRVPVPVAGPDKAADGYRWRAMPQRRRAQRAAMNSPDHCDRSRPVRVGARVAASPAASARRRRPTRCRAQSRPCPAACAGRSAIRCRRPARRLVLPAAGQHLLVAARRAHHADADACAGPAGEGDPLAVGAPDRRRIARRRRS